MTAEIKGAFAEMLQGVEKKYAEDKKALEEKSQLCEIIKIEVIKELEKKYDHKEFEEQFGKLLTLLEDHFETGSESSKKAILKTIPILRDLNKW